MLYHISMIVITITTIINLFWVNVALDYFLILMIIPKLLFFDSLMGKGEKHQCNTHFCQVRENNDQQWT